MINADAFFEDAIVECRKTWAIDSICTLNKFLTISSHSILSLIILFCTLIKFTLDLSGKVERIQTSDGIILNLQIICSVIVSMLFKFWCLKNILKY